MPIHHLEVGPPEIESSDVATGIEKVHQQVGRGSHGAKVEASQVHTPQELKAWLVFANYAHIVVYKRCWAEPRCS